MKDMEKRRGKCYLVGAGDLYGSIDPCEEDLVIAADGGLVHLERLGIKPSVIVGDFDSVESLDRLFPYISEEELTRVKNCESCGIESVFSGRTVEVVRRPVMKDETDLCLAYRIGASKGYTEFEIYGGVGGREDHTFANYCLLLEAKNDKNDVALIGNGAKIFVIKDEKKRIFGAEGSTVSVFAFGERAEGVSIRGLKYEAEEITLLPEIPLGVSNSFLASGEGEIEVKKGALLVINYG